MSWEGPSRPSDESAHGVADPASRHGEEELRPTLSMCAPCRFRAITPEPSTVSTTIPPGAVPLNALPTIRKYSPGGSTVPAGMVARIRGVEPAQAWIVHPPTSAPVEPVLRSSTNPLDPSAISFTFTGETPGVPPSAAPASSRYVATELPGGVTIAVWRGPGGRHRRPKTFSAWDLREDGDRGVSAVHRSSAWRRSPAPVRSPSSGVVFPGAPACLACDRRRLVHRGVRHVERRAEEGAPVGAGNAFSAFPSRHFFTSDAVVL
ncbi:hypothetical protein DFR72_120119 [Lentzea flaviverrucosa]|uniref:Uncharacterized protein n=1 Tax=Lentzea flaviverrucosa TaxID=200379 RepID=A0A1H9KJ81_9PSEU|nr:hypothetical protein DFR72_120119 [Lentzea flaviverrucosa]SEQ99206.1 hypothetical protein SAMN05216195_103618 [Lentzea flaviverrucosa]